MSEPLLDLTDLQRQATQVTMLPLHLTTWQDEYKEKLGLTTTTSTDDPILPLHPYPLGLEVEHYQDQLNKVKKKYIQLATKHHFLLAILQDPPRHVQPDQVKEQDTAVLQQYGELTFLLRDVVKLKQAIADGNRANEKARQALHTASDTLMQMLDEMEEQKTTLQSLHTLNEKYATLRTPEQAQQVLQEQTQQLAQINEAIDQHNDTLEELQLELGDRRRDIEMLETTYQKAHAQANEAILHTGQSTHRIQQHQWYTDITQLWQAMFGIQKVRDEIDMLQITYATGDLLSIHLDPLTDQITGLEVNNNDAVDLTDLESMVNGQPVKDVASMVVLETLARTR